MQETGTFQFIGVISIGSIGPKWSLQKLTTNQRNSLVQLFRSFCEVGEFDAFIEKCQDFLNGTDLNEKEAIALARECWCEKYGARTEEKNENKDEAPKTRKSKVGKHVLDGQHRLSALRQLQRVFPEISKFKIPVQIYHCETELQMYDIYHKVNSNKPVPLYDGLNDTLAIHDIEDEMTRRFKPFLKKSEKPRIPNVSLKRVMEKIQKSRKCLDDVVDRIVGLHLYYSSFTPDVWARYQVKDVVLLEKCRQQDKGTWVFCFFGLYKDCEWVDWLFDDWDKVDHTPLWLREVSEIPRARRNELWQTTFGKSMTGQCFCCKTELSFTNFDAGHVQSRYRGGSNELDNLRVVCKICNRDMGTMDLMEYAQCFQ